MPSRPSRVTALLPPRVALDEAALTRHEPLLRALHARADGVACGPLLLRRLTPSRAPSAPPAPRLRWHVPAVPFLRLPALRARVGEGPRRKQRP
ncbi:hypothetical protein [Actinomadura rubrisoli]|uniref:Uncharacterized protein n=1 Tax=Actinomadura rubrisoli TaxID=2530368 RepID=A0A4R5BZL2_9ACTN|nr:hypothetical protein [Actinomadura rubrisoli]TDD89832.1 hypothetical protein E1298_13635 [Actinomadura rubrisoli]